MGSAMSVLSFQHRIGDDATLTVPITTSAGAAVDCTSGTLTLSARAYPGSSTETFTEATTGVTLTGTTTGATVAFTEAALASVTPGTYVFTISRTVGGVTTTYPINGHFILTLLPLLQ